MMGLFFFSLLFFLLLEDHLALVRQTKSYANRAAHSLVIVLPLERLEKVRSATQVRGWAGERPHKTLMSTSLTTAAGSWDDLRLSPRVLQIVKCKLNFQTMTPVQAHTIPPFLSYKDVAVEVRVLCVHSWPTIGTYWIWKDACIRDTNVWDVVAKEGTTAISWGWCDCDKPNKVPFQQ